jgi:hypothetical protein
MKIIRVLVAAATLLAAVSFAAEAAGVSLELGAVGYDFNSGSAPQAVAPSTPITNSADFSPDVYLNGSYTLTLDKTTKLKLGVFAEDMMGTISPSYTFIGRAEPYADFSAGSFSARVSFPLYLLGYDTTNDPKFDEIKYLLDSYCKGINLSTVYSSTNTFLATNFESLSYRLTLGSAAALVLSATTEIGFSPVFWLHDVKPQITVIWGPVQLDLKESIYNVDASLTPNPAADTGYNVRWFTDPKLTLNFASIGIAGLKAYVGASLFTYQIFPNTGDSAWYNTSSGKAAAFGSSITPGVSYSIGPFYAEASFKIHNYDDSVTNAAKKDPTFDPALKVSYTLSF